MFDSNLCVSAPVWQVLSCTYCQRQLNCIFFFQICLCTKWMFVTVSWDHGSVYFPLTIDTHRFISSTNFVQLIYTLDLYPVFCLSTTGTINKPSTIQAKSTKVHCTSRDIPEYLVDMVVGLLKTTTTEDLRNSLPLSACNWQLLKLATTSLTCLNLNALLTAVNVHPQPLFSSSSSSSSSCVCSCCTSSFCCSCLHSVFVVVCNLLL